MITIFTAAFTAVTSSAAVEERANPLPTPFGLVTVSNYSGANRFRATLMVRLHISTYACRVVNVFSLLGDSFTFMS